MPHVTFRLNRRYWIVIPKILYLSVLKDFFENQKIGTRLV